MADTYAEYGFDVLVGTDHHYALGVDGDVESETVGDYSQLDFPGPILAGVELSAGHHVNVIKSDTEMLKQINHPMRYDDTAADINRLAERIGADLVEVTERGERLSAYPTVADAVEELDPSPVITSDAHSPEAVGAGYVVVEVDELTGDNVIRALKDGNYSLGGQAW
jgi:histidinol phosphatase-like PHP family hydrolase